MKKELLCYALCLALTITVGCSNDEGKEIANEPEDIQVQEITKEQPLKEVQPANTQPITISIDGQDLIFPISRDDAERFITENGYELERNNRVVITGYNEARHGFLNFDFFDEDPTVCTGVEVQEIPVVCGELLDKGINTYESVYELCNSTDSNYKCIYQKEGGADQMLGIQQNDADNCYRISFQGEPSKFCAFINRNAYDNYGSVSYDFEIYEGYYLSSTDIDGLYLYSPPEGYASSYINYFYREGLDFKIDKAVVCTVESRDISLDSSRESFDNIFVGKDVNGNVVEIYMAGTSAETYASAQEEFEEYSDTNNIEIEPKELLEQLIPSLWHKDVIETLGALLSKNPDMKGNKATFRINKESTHIDYDMDTTLIDLKITIDEYPDVMILAKANYDYESSFGMSVTCANVIPGKQLKINHSNDSVIIMDEPSDITSEFDDFFPASVNYDNLPTTLSIHDYVGYYASGVPGSTNMLIEDASGNPVALYLGQHDYSDYNKVPIIEYGDSQNYPDTEMMDGLDFSSGVDADGNYVFIE